MAKRGAQGTGNIRLRKDGRFEGRYTLGIDPGTGKQVQKSVYGATKKEAGKKLQKILAEIEAGTYTEPSKMTLKDWLNIWVDEYTGHLKPRTINVYKSHIEQHFIPALGAVRLQQLKPPQIQSFYNSLQKKEKPLSPKSIKNIHGVLHKAMQQAVEIGYIRQNPTQTCKLPRVEKAPVHALDEDQITTLLQYIKGHRFETLYTVDTFTGMRQSEILGLTWDCVDFEKGTIRLYRQWQIINGVRGFHSLKNGKSRTITPAPYVIQLLQQQKRTQTEWQLQAGPAWHNEEGFVFTDRHGYPLKHDIVYRSFKRITQQLEFPNIRFHDMRHTYASACIHAGDDIKALQENMGHHTAAFTLDAYGHISKQGRKESANKMEQYITRITAKKAH